MRVNEAFSPQCWTLHTRWNSHSRAAGTRGRVVTAATDRLACSQRFEDLLHHRRADTVSEQANTITSTADRKGKGISKSHGTRELRHLHHSPLWTSWAGLYQREPIDAGAGAPRTIKRPPAASAV